MWVKLDDSFADHPKVVGLSHRAFRVFVSGLCYANRYLTDGALTVGAQHHLSCPRVIATELVRAGLWEIGNEGAFLIHDYLTYQPDRETTLLARQETHEQHVAAGKARAATARRDGGRFAPAGDQRDAGTALAPAHQRSTSPVPGPGPVPVGSERTLGRPEEDGLRYRGVLKAMP